MSHLPLLHEISSPLRTSWDERRREGDGSLRVVYAASIRSCRPCPLEFAPVQIDEPAKATPDPVSQPADPTPVTYGPPQWARPSYTKGFAGADFSLQTDGTLRCPAGCPLYPQERRKEHNGSDAECFMQRGSAIVARVRSVSSVKNRQRP